MIEQDFNPSTQKAESRRISWVWGQPGLLSEFQDNQGYMSQPLLPQKRQTGWTDGWGIQGWCLTQGLHNQIHQRRTLTPGNTHFLFICIRALTHCNGIFPWLACLSWGQGNIQCPLLLPVLLCLLSTPRLLPVLLCLHCTNTAGQRPCDSADSTYRAAPRCGNSYKGGWRTEACGIASVELPIGFTFVYLKREGGRRANSAMCSYVYTHTHTHTASQTMQIHTLTHTIDTHTK